MHYLFGLIHQFSPVKRFACYLLMAITLSCSFGGDNNQDKKSSNYQLRFSSSKWTKMNPGTADHAFYHRDSHSIILLNTLCEKYESTSLHHLISNMLGGIDEIQVVKEESLIYSKRDSLRSFVSGKTDGVPVYLVIQTVRKNNCIYDFVMISQTQDKQDDDLGDFNKFLDETKIN